ncbi:MAG: hypothetical protein RL662_626 [Bacteroidota bacterium]
MRLTYIYHSAFAIETDDFTIIIDYFEDSISKERGVVHDRLLRRPQKLYVLASHSHHDHFNPEIFDWREIRNDISYILSEDIKATTNIKYFDVTFIDKDDEYKDDLIEIKAYGSTDLGISLKIKFGGYTLFHAGDLNNWHWKEEFTPEQVGEAQDYYLRELDHLAASTPKIDLAMFPVDPRLGVDYMLGADQFLQKIPTTLFVPMHFGEAYDEAKAIRSVAEKYNTKVYAPPHKGDALEEVENLL